MTQKHNEFYQYAHFLFNRLKREGLTPGIEGSEGYNIFVAEYNAAKKKHLLKQTEERRYELKQKAEDYLAVFGPMAGILAVGAMIGTGIYLKLNSKSLSKS